MPLSNDPEKRSRQLANLTPGVAAAGSGNVRAVSHGAFARVTGPRLAAKVREIVGALTEDAPVREVDGSLPAADAPAVRLLAETLCRLDSIGEYLDRRGWEGEDGKPRPVLEYEARLRTQSLDLLKELGMTPASRAKLGLDLARTARSLEDELADGRAAWQQREGSGAVVDGTANELGEGE